MLNRSSEIQHYEHSDATIKIHKGIITTMGLPDVSIVLTVWADHRQHKRPGAPPTSAALEPGLGLGGGGGRGKGGEEEGWREGRRRGGGRGREEWWGWSRRRSGGERGGVMREGKRRVVGKGGRGEEEGGGGGRREGEKEGLRRDLTKIVWQHTVTTLVHVYTCKLIPNQENLHGGSGFPPGGGAGLEKGGSFLGTFTVEVENLLGELGGAVCVGGEGVHGCACACMRVYMLYVQHVSVGVNVCMRERERESMCI